MICWILFIIFMAIFALAGLSIINPKNRAKAVGTPTVVVHVEQELNPLQVMIIAFLFGALVFIIFMLI